jgi:hypothetical protein
VPPAAASIHFGFYMAGFGTAYARHIELVAVDVGAARPLEAGLPASPANLQLELA